MSERERRLLDGIKVLDFSHVLAGPYCGRILCDLGAEVVKVEAPAGDVLLRLGAASYTHFRAHETSLYLVCRLLLEKKK